MIEHRGSKVERISHGWVIEPDLPQDRWDGTVFHMGCIASGLVIRSLPIFPVRLAIPTLFVWLGPAEAQDASDAAELLREVAAAHEEAVAAAESVHDELTSLVPSVPGWTCAEEEQRDDTEAEWMAANPLVSMRCEHGKLSLTFDLVLDQSSLGLDCADMVMTKRDIREGRAEPDRFRILERWPWQTMRDGVDLKGCKAGKLAFPGWGVTAWWKPWLVDRRRWTPLRKRWSARFLVRSSWPWRASGWKPLSPG